MRTCSACGFFQDGGDHMMKYDAYWCPECDVWMSEGCGGAECEFCAGRPERPSMVTGEDRVSWNGGYQ